MTGGFPSHRASNVDRWHLSSELLYKYSSGWWYETITIMDWCNLNCYDYSTCQDFKDFFKDCIIWFFALPAFIWLNTIRCLFWSYFCEILNLFRQNIRKIDVVFIVSLDKLLIKQLSCQWFETPWHTCGITVMTNVDFYYGWDEYRMMSNHNFWVVMSHNLWWYLFGYLWKSDLPSNL